MFECRLHKSMGDAINVTKNMTFFTFMIFVSVGNKHYVKSVQIRSFFWTVSSCVWTEYGKIETRKNSVFGNFSRSGKIKTIGNTKKGKNKKRLIFLQELCLPGR